MPRSLERPQFAVQSGEVTRGGYHPNFPWMLKILQQKEMLDVSLGLDVLSVEFIENKLLIGIGRHHVEGDK